MRRINTDLIAMSEAGCSNSVSLIHFGKEQYKNVGKLDLFQNERESSPHCNDSFSHFCRVSSQPELGRGPDSPNYQNFAPDMRGSGVPPPGAPQIVPAGAAGAPGQYPPPHHPNTSSASQLPNRSVVIEIEVDSLSAQTHGRVELVVAAIELRANAYFSAISIVEFFLDNKLALESLSNAKLGV